MSSTKTSKSTVSVMKKIYWNVPISKFSRNFFTQHKTGKKIESEPFSISSCNEKTTKWCFDLFPNGEHVEQRSNVSLYVHCENAKDTTFDFAAKYKLGVQKSDGEDCFIFPEESLTKDELKEGGWGEPEFLSHEQLFKKRNGYVVGGKLVILIEIQVEFTVEAEITEPPTKIARLSSPLADFKKMFENESLSDCELKTCIDGGVLKAHRFALAARSPAFFAMLAMDRQGTANVPDFSSKVMKEVLRFIYYNEVAELKEIATELVLAAEKFQLEELKDICLQEITSSLQVGNAVKFLKIAYQLSDAEELFEKCLDLIVNNHCGDVSKELSWKELPNELLLKIIGRLCEQRNAPKLEI